MANAETSSHLNSPPLQGGVVPRQRDRGGSGISNLPFLKAFRRQLRNHSTPAEARLWTLLKGRQLAGRKFRRQHSVAGYILDFYCPSESLAIELDGEVHSRLSVPEYDRERTLFLKHTGIKVLRFENRVVFEHPDWILEQIRDHYESGQRSCSGRFLSSESETSAE